MGMKSRPDRPWIWLAAVVIAHLAISFVHGAAHAQAHISMSPAGNLFVFGVILAGPVIGLALALRFRRVGAWVIGITMAASLVFGVANHFVLASADHVDAGVIFGTGFAPFRGGPLHFAATEQKSNVEVLRRTAAE